MSLRRKINLLVEKIIAIVHHCAITLSVLLVILVCVGIFSRYIFKYPLNWMPGIVTLLTDWAIFLMVGVYISRNKGITIPYFYEKLFTPKLKLISDILVNIIIISFTTITGWYCLKSLQMGGYLATISTIPIYYYWYTMPFFIGMMIGLAGTINRLINSDCCA